MLTLVAILALLPAFLRLADIDSGRDRRFVEAMIPVSGLPEPVLPALCRDYGALAEAGVRRRLCKEDPSLPPPADNGVPLLLREAWSRAWQAFAAAGPNTLPRPSDVRARQREGSGDRQPARDGTAAVAADARLLEVRRGQREADAGRLRPLACALALTTAALAEPGNSPIDGVMRANALLLLGAALDGHGATAALTRNALLPAPPDGRDEKCRQAGLAASLASAAALVNAARGASAYARKNEAMRRLLHTAGWQWAGWMLLGLGLVKLSRRGVAPAAGVALTLAAWALAAWFGHVPWPLVRDRAFIPARATDSFLAAPADFVLWLLLAAAVLALFATRQDERPSLPPQTLATRIGYPGLVCATGIGWLLLLDLSATGHFSNRYLALYHQGHLWLGMLVLSALCFLRPLLGHRLAWALALLDELVGRLVRKLAPLPRIALAAACGLAIAGAIALASPQVPQLTSELGRAWLIVGAAWFFFLRGGPLAERLAETGRVPGSLLRYLAPLLFVAFVLLAVLLQTHDMGPLLITSYAAGAFLAASVAMWWRHRHRAPRVAPALALTLFGLWVVATSVALYRIGPLDDTTAARLESAVAPLSASNDQLALVAWFRRAAPARGFNSGSVPWCGYSSGDGCPGVPAQIHSDYTFSALVGEFGLPAAWCASLACAFWLHRLIRHHGRATRGEPRLLKYADHMVFDVQAFVSWLGLTWVVLTSCQLAVTVTGNLGVLPLTGVTFPFASFGMTSLVANMAFLALCLNVSLPTGDRHG